MMKIESKAKLIEWALQAKYLWLFLDYDGTLADFAPTPEYIEPDPRVISLLKKLTHKPTVRIAILSGRRLQHVRLLLPISGIFLAGTYGIELLTPTGELIQRMEYDSIRPVLDRIKPRWAEILRGRNGFFLEDKGWTLALHARFAEDEEAEEVLNQAQQMIDTELLKDHFRILGGHKFLEIAPRLASKKETVAYLLNQYPLPDARLIYIGDDDKDEEAFSLIHAQHGVAMKVWQPSQAMRPTDADFPFKSPAETLHWLNMLA
jgi:trehalose 6-phosphate phosphatase